MKRALIIATVGRFYEFLKSDISILQEMGYEVHCATNLCMNEFDGMRGFRVRKHQIDFARSPFAKTNVRAFLQLRQLLRHRRFDLVHVHTPMGSMLGRLAAGKYRKAGTRILYTAHGFHFYAGAPLKNWLIYFTAEWLTSFWTDVLITINREDYGRAKRHLHAHKTCYIPSVGVDIGKFEEGGAKAEEKRRQIGIRDDEIMMVSVGEISRRKNQGAVIDALEELQLANVVYVICGEGAGRAALEEKVHKARLDEKVIFLGQRNDVASLYQAADLFVLPSYQEGVSMALLEAAASRLPVLCSNIRGTVDVIKDDSLLFHPDKPYELAALLRGKFFGNEKPSEVVDRARFLERMRPSAEENYENVQKFRLQRVAKKMRSIYTDAACAVNDERGNYKRDRQ